MHRRRMVLAVLLAVAIVVPVVVIVGSVEAHPPPPPGVDDPDTVWPPGVAVDPINPGLYEYFWDPETRAMVPAHDFVRVAPNAVVELHMRANDAVSFGVCPSTVSLQQCRDDSLHEAAGGTCGEAVEYANGVGGKEVLGHHHVITLCSGMYALSGLTMLSGDAYASLAKKRGSITEAYPDGGASGGVIEVTAGPELGVAEAEYCMTSYPNPCRRRARIDIVVEPDGWADARVVGVNDEYRLELDWSVPTHEVVLKARDSSATPWNDADVVGSYCCLANLDYWSFNLRLPVMVGSERVVSGRDKVVFYEAGGTAIGETLCRPLYCEQIIPQSPTVSSWEPPGVDDTIGVDVESAGRSLNVTLRGNPDRPGIKPASGSVVRTIINYCLAHWQQRCGASSCARATYRNAPNLTLAPWVNTLPSSAFVASTNCPSAAEVRLEVADVTPSTFDRALFSPPLNPTSPPPPPPPGAAPPWEYGPSPADFSPSAAEPRYWCFPGRFLDDAIGDLEGDAGLWVDDSTTTAVLPARKTRFERYYLGHDAENNAVAGWGPLPDPDPHPDTGEIRNRDTISRHLVEREYESLLLNPDAFPERDPTIGQVWLDEAVAVYSDFVDDFAGAFARHYRQVTPPDDVLDPIPTPAMTPSLQEFIDVYLTAGGRWYVDPTVGSGLRLRREAQRGGLRPLRHHVRRRVGPRTPLAWARAVGLSAGSGSCGARRQPAAPRGLSARGEPGVAGAIVPGRGRNDDDRGGAGNLPRSIELGFRPVRVRPPLGHAARPDTAAP